MNQVFDSKNLCEKYLKKGLHIALMNLGRAYDQVDRKCSEYMGQMESSCMGVHGKDR